ncbi:toll/interleukin-1 receptor domain-containing protein [Crocinitomix catalasitica]|uniref:toll/interleukin-1 receptor domain-containing protein n=1 Tax=Crocinitomix catalasitica TaxID=184607 RepID=UPI0004816ED2|nr:toll/interleukin-1 receptor domain-containing protein [Crocinitomix catalasitica]
MNTLQNIESFTDLTKQVINDFKLVSLKVTSGNSSTNRGSYRFTLMDQPDNCFVDIIEKRPEDRGTLAKTFNNKARIVKSSNVTIYSFYIVFNYTLTANDRQYYESKIKSRGNCKFYIWDKSTILKMAKDKGFIEKSTSERISEMNTAMSKQYKNEKSGIVEGKIFISHSEKDELLAKELIQLFTSVSNLGPEDFICSSVEGSKIEPASDWVSFIEEGIDNAPLIIFLLTSSFMESKASYWEFGLTMGKKRNYFILMDNELAYDSIGFLSKYQVEILNENGALDRLKDEVEECKNLKKIKTDAWNDRKKDFLNKLKK